MRYGSKITLLVGLALGAGGCGARLDSGPAVPREGEVRRAALARITVENRTERRLDIAFRPANSPDHEVVVGRVEPRDTATVAPVLAGEPIVLVARAQDRSEYRSPARSFEIDATWLWVIPSDAAFLGSSGRTPPR